MNMMEVMVKVKHLKKYFPLGKKRLRKKQEYVYAVDDVSFDVTRGETLGLVGESGCGKSTVGRAIMRLYEPTAGDVLYNGQNLLDMKDEELRTIRKDMSMIFQDPYSSLNPRLQVLDIVAEPLRTHTDITGPKLRDAVLTLLGHVGLGQEHLMRYPHEFSGGQRQRIAIARALALNPSFIILDEPTSALDVSVQAQVLNLLADLQSEFNLTYLFISHNLAVVEYISHNLAIMYLGKIVEMGRTSQIFKNPRHHYSKALLSAILNPDPDQADEEIILSGDVPSPVNVPSGCRFRTRCPKAENLCSQKEPEFREIETGHMAACHFIS
jgi:oligopeptide/dipeptide ABC transporter ATP-binding protein